MASVQKPIVLVVDDEEANRMVCRDALELNGYTVVVAAGPREAIEVLSMREVDVVVCDVSMPHNGMRVYEYLLENFPELRTRFIFVTGNPGTEANAERLPQGIRCLLKPFPLRLLLEAMKAALGA